jgi:hypothetical protein
MSSLKSEYYDEDYLADNKIVELENGEYEQMEEAIEINGDWYSIDDDRICRFEDTDEYGLTEDGWQCASSCNWYTDDCTKFTEFKGERYHDDYIPQEIADATADKRIDEDEGMPTMLTLDMLWNVHMIWDYSIAMDSVTISLTYTLDGKKLIRSSCLRTLRLSIAKTEQASTEWYVKYFALTSWHKPTRSQTNT